MNNEPVLTEEDRIQEELVAYLDDELDAEASERVRRRLRDDPAYQKKLKALQSAWDLLDELPRAHVNDTFTQSTIEMVYMSVEADLSQLHAKNNRRRYLGVGLFAVCLLAAAGVGFAVMAQRFDAPNQRLLKDLPVIENVDLYAEVDDIKFLRELDASGLFEKEESSDAR